MRLLEFEIALIDESFIALGATDGNVNIVLNFLGRIATAHHSRYTELSGDNGRMTGSATTVRYDGRGALHDRLPVRVRHIRDQNITGLNTAHFANVANDFRFTGTDLLPNAASGSNNAGVGLERVALDSTATATLHGLRAGLKNVELAVVSVLAPLDVHRALVVIFDGNRHFRQRSDVFIGQ